MVKRVRFCERVDICIFEVVKRVSFFERIKKFFTLTF